MCNMVSLSVNNKNIKMLRLLWGLVSYVFYGLWKELSQVSAKISKGKKRKRVRRPKAPLLPITTKHIQIKSRIIVSNCPKNHHLLFRFVIAGLCGIAFTMFIGYHQSVNDQSRKSYHNNFEQRVPVQQLRNQVNVYEQEAKEKNASGSQSESIEVQADVFAPSSLSPHDVINNEQSAQLNPPNSIYDMTVQDINNKAVDLKQFSGQVLLIVNIAMDANFSEQNFAGLQMLHKKYGPYGLKILAFPTQEFTSWEIRQGLLQKQLQDTYGVTFPLYQKVDVNGAQAHPLYALIQRQLGYTSSLDYIFPWNFQKILVNRRGQITKWYDRWFDQQQIETAVYDLLVQPLDNNQQ